MSSPPDPITRGEARALLIKAGYAPTSLYAFWPRLVPISGAGAKAVYRRADVEAAAEAMRGRGQPKPEAPPKPRKHSDRVPSPPPPEATTLTWGQGLRLATEAGLSVGGAQTLLYCVVGPEDRPRDQPPTILRAALDAELRRSLERRERQEAVARAVATAEYRVRAAGVRVAEEQKVRLAHHYVISLGLSDERHGETRHSKPG